VKNYTVDHQNYHIFKAESGTENQFVHFQWGKFDFRMTFSSTEIDDSRINSKKTFSSQNGSKFIADKFEVLYHNEWYEYVKPTAHGMQFEETLWRSNGRDYYVEFPRDLRNVAQSISAEELGLSSL
jgi:hypothetical protein